MVFRIALYTNQFPSTVNTFFSRDVIALLRNGFDIDVYTVYPVKDANWHNVPVQWRGEIRDQVNIRYVSPIHCVDIPDIIRDDVRNILAQSRNFGIVQWIKSILVIRQAINWYEINHFKKYDYFLSYWGNYSATYAYLCNKLMGLDVPFSFFLHAGTDLYRDQIYLIEKIKFSKNIFTVCDFNKIFLSQLYPDKYSSFEDKIILHHLGLDLENFMFNKNRESNVLLSVGWFTKAKGFEYAIRALPLILEKFPNVTLRIIGDGEDKNRLVKLAKEQGVQNSVCFLGWLPFEKVRAEMEKAALLIHPSSGLGDAVPTVIKEAIALGLPVVGSNIAGIPELLGNGKYGVLIPPANSSALANSIISLLENKDARDNFSVSGREFAEQEFNMWKNGKKLSEVIRGYGSAKR
jgi:glycosyltransferase involved in cell wall biosynthesis